MTKIVWDVSTEFWHDFVADCPTATFFHGPAWYLANAEALGYVPHPCQITFTNGQEVLVPLATRRTFRGLMTEACAGLESGYGGLLHAGSLDSERVAEAYDLVRRRFPDLHVIGNPHSHGGVSPQADTLSLDFTQAVPILDRAKQQWLMSQTRGNLVRRAAKSGFIVDICERPGEGHVHSLFPVYREHVADWVYRKHVRDEAYFKSLFRQAGQQLVLFRAWHEGRLAGFSLIGTQGLLVSYLYLATARAYEPMHVASLLVAEPLAWCHERGYKNFDFLPSGPLEGVKRFKGSFGATSMPYWSGRQTTWLNRSLTGCRKLLKASSAPA